VEKPVIAITMGDPAGVGPELIVKVLFQEAAHQSCRPLVIADPEVMRGAGKLLGAGLRFRDVEHPAEARFSPPDVDVLRPASPRVDRVVWGKVDPAMGKAATVCLEKAYELAAAGQVDGLVAAPMNKQAFHLYGAARGLRHRSPA